MLLHALVQAYVVRPLRLAEETQLILNANPRHRIEFSGPSEIVQLAVAINALAARRELLQSDVEHRVAETNRNLERERNLLAALMSELSESVIVCNTAGSILLYNERARQLLGSVANGDRARGAADWIGLGRSLFAGIDREVVAHAVDHLHHRLRQGDAFPISEFVTATRGGRLIRARMAAVAGDAADSSAAPEVSGFVLILDDVQRDVDLGILRERVLKSLTEGTRASLANIRAAAETLMQYPQMASSQHKTFLNVIQDETEKLGRRLEESLTDDARRLGGEWPLATMLGRDLLRALQRTVETRCRCPVALEADNEPIWLSVDSFLLVEGLAHLATRLQTGGRARDMTLRMARNGSRTRLDLCWCNDPLSVEMALEREKEPIAIPGHPQPLSFKDIVERHGGEAWYQRDAGSGRACLCMLLPSAEEDAARFAPTRAASRPIFYDFDLFHQAGQRPEIDQRLLSDLSYTVFDTETTGLEPSQGDEIIAIGAVRIVNGRLLTAEVFDQLVNPCRDMEKASVNIHGITDAMLRDQPTIERVLPRFHRFCENTVLVAHNAAFDMRFLQLKEKAAGLTFSHPVLDTLMLSAVVHPNQTDHTLEAIAARLGVNVIGRHTALGDAIVAGEIFLKMIPLLTQQGIVTFRQAHQAAQKTPFARISY
jgi:DNA polymerase-3 subunit epsilon